MPRECTIIGLAREYIKINKNRVTRTEIHKYCHDNNAPFGRNDEKRQLHCISGELSKLKSWGEVWNENGKWYKK